MWEIEFVGPMRLSGLGNLITVIDFCTRKAFAYALARAFVLRSALSFPSIPTCPGTDSKEIEYARDF